MNINRQSQSSILSKTNRQFYIRRKKSPDDQTDLNIDKALKSLIKKNENYRYVKPKRTILTQKYQQQSKTKTNDKYFQLIQAKRILENNIKKCNTNYNYNYNALFRSFQKCFNSGSIQQVQFYQLDFYQKFNQIILIQLDRNKNIQNTLDSVQKIKQSKDNAIFLQNMKLQKQNQLLRKQIKYSLIPTQQILKQILKDQANILIGSGTCNNDILNTNNNTNSNSNSHNHNQKYIKKDQNSQQIVTSFITLQRKMEIKNQQLQILRRQMDSLKEELFLLKQDKKSLKQRISQLKIKNQNLCSEIISLQLKNKKMGVSDDRRQAIMSMQNQQIESYRNQMYQLRKLYNNLNRKHKGLIIKFKKTAQNNDHKIGAMLNKQIKYFPEQLEAFEQIRGKIHPSNRIYIKSKPLQKTGLYQGFLCGKQTMNNREGVKKIYSIGSQYFYPSFYMLISQDMNFFGIDQGSFQHFNSTIKLNFIGVIRAIMDSKFNQFILKRKSIHSSSFPAFTFAWLNTYQLNQSKKVQKINTNNISTRQSICMFYVNLMSQKLNNSWQVISFRQFLLQTFNNDELYFYLNLRYLLIGGDMTRDLSFCFQQIYYVDFNRTFNTIMKILKQIDQQTKKIYEQFLKRSIVYIRKKSFLDLHYILRIMLQFYQSKKQKQIQRILKTIDMVTQSCKNNISFPQFVKIFDFHFNFLSCTEIVDLYRKCFCVGNGSINAQTVITVLIQQNIFLGWVQTHIFNTQIKLQQISRKNVKQKTEQQQVQFVIIPNIQWVYQNQKKFRFIYNSQLIRQTNRIGIQQFSINIRQNFKLSSQSIFQRLQLIFQLCMMTQKKFYYSGLVSNQQLEQSLELVTQFLTNFSKITLLRNETHQLMQYLKYQAASNKIKQFYHKKRAEMTRSLLYAYSNSMNKDMNSQKNSILRTQFMQIIEQAKVKRKIASIKQVYDDGID